MAKVTVIGIEPIIKKLEKAGGPGVLRRPMTKAVAHLHRVIAVYPAASSANSPANGYSWYERGFGVRTRTGRGYPTSETLGRRWTHVVKNDGKRGEVGNNASYGPYVQSDERQAAFHKRRGWKTDKDVADKEARKVVGFFDEEYRDLLK